MMPTAIVVSVGADERPHRETLQHNAEQGPGQDGEEASERQRQAGINAHHGKDCADHQRVAVGEVHGLGGRPHDVEAECDEGVDAPDREA
jgi:hypothetical protein